MRGRNVVVFCGEVVCIVVHIRRVLNLGYQDRWDIWDTVIDCGQLAVNWPP